MHSLPNDKAPQGGKVRTRNSALEGERERDIEWAIKETEIGLRRAGKPCRNCVTITTAKMRTKGSQLEDAL